MPRACSCPTSPSCPGIPADDALRVDVWRGELAVGDSLLLVSRNLTEVVGTEELKNAVVTLHPQSAVEHLHHLFVAAGGDGSDAVVALEATEMVAAPLGAAAGPASRAWWIPTATCRAAPSPAATRSRAPLGRCSGAVSGAARGGERRGLTGAGTASWT